MKNIILFLSLCFFSIVKSQHFAEVTDTIEADSWEEAMERTFGLLPKAHYSTGYLLDKTSFLPKFGYACGTLNDSSFNMLEWYFLQNIVRTSYYRPDSFAIYSTIDSLKNRYIHDNDILPWGLIDIETNVLRDSALLDGSILIDDYRFKENSGNLSKMYSTKKLFCAVPLNMEVLTLNPSFILLPDNTISNNTDTISHIHIDLDDGLGFQEVEINNTFQATYIEGGFKTFLTRIIYTSGDTLYSRSELEVIDPDPLAREADVYNHYDSVYVIDGDAMGGSSPLGLYPSEFSVTYHNKQDGESGAKYAQIGVWFGCGNTSRKIRKPFLVFGGYNPKNGKAIVANSVAPWLNDALGAVLALSGWRGPLYETYNGFFTNVSKNADHGQSFGSNGNNFLDKIRQEGYDILLVRFYDGVGYMQNSAFLATLILKDLNYRILNETDGALNPGAALDPEDPSYPNSTKLKRAKHEIVVAGYSAGGMCSRLGLTLMEYQHLSDRCDVMHRQHRVKIWLGFDCEVQGSNTPIGQQMFMDFEASLLAYPANVADVANSLICKTALDLMAIHGVATQNSLYHLGNMIYSGNSNWNVGHHQDFDDYFTDLNAVYHSSLPANLRGYPNKPYRIAATQGSAYGYGQLMGATVQMLDNESPTDVCANLLDPLTNVIGNLASGGNPMVVTTPYRQASARVLMPSNDNAFTCKYGLALRTLVYTWHTNIGHWKYHDNNHITDQIFGAHQSYDVAAASTLPTHLLVGSKLPLSVTNLVVAAATSCNFKDYSNYQDGFCPTPSGLDLHNPGNNTLPRYPDLSLVPGNTGGGMHLMQQNNYPDTSLNRSPHNDFGYPHLTYPTTHYDYTPYDAIWAHGRNISTTNYDDNTMHVEDPTPYSGEFLVEEIAPQTLYLSNRTIQGESYVCSGVSRVEKYYSDFEARNSILVGDQTIYEHDITSRYPRVRTNTGDFVLGDGAVVTMRANNDDGISGVVLGAGFSSKHGSIFRAYVYNDPNMCAPFSYGARQIARQKPTENKSTRPIISSKRASNLSLQPENKNRIVSLYPNPTNSCVYYNLRENTTFNYYVHDVAGRELERGELTGRTNKIELKRYDAGVYFITIISTDIKQTDRIILE